MIQKDEDALICDLAETYHIFNYREVPLKLLATLSVGLKDDSRIMMRLANHKISLNYLLLAGILDNVRTLTWFYSEEGSKGIDRPASIINMLLGIEEEGSVAGFNSVEEFEKRRKQIIGGK